MNRFPIRSLSKPSTQVMYLVGAVLCGFIGYKVGIEALQKQTTNIIDWIIGTGAIIATVIFLLAPWWLRL